MNAELELKKAGFVLPKGAKAIGSYIPVLQIGNMLYLSGVLSKTVEGEVFKGRAGADSTVERGEQAARLAVLNALGMIRDHLGNLDQVERIVRLVGYVQSAPEFQEHPKVLNGASDLLIKIFGDNGRHTRSAIGVSSLPVGALVEIELTLQVASQ